MLVRVDAWFQLMMEVLEEEDLVFLLLTKETCSFINVPQRYGSSFQQTTWERAPTLHSLPVIPAMAALWVRGGTPSHLAQPSGLCLLHAQTLSDLLPRVIRLYLQVLFYLLYALCWSSFYDGCISPHPWPGLLSRWEQLLLPFFINKPVKFWPVAHYLTHGAVRTISDWWQCTWWGLSRWWE